MVDEDTIHVKFPRGEDVSTAITGGAVSSSSGRTSVEIDQFDAKNVEATPKRSELEEMTESMKVCKVNGLAVCSRDIAGIAQTDYDNRRSYDGELKWKAAEESGAMHNHEGELMKNPEVPIPELDIEEVKSGVVLDSLKMQVSRQYEIDCIARHQVVEFVRTSEFKQGTHAEGSWIENSKGDIVRYRSAAKQAAYEQRRDVRQTISALPIFPLLFSIVGFVMLSFHGSDMMLSVWDNLVASSHAVMDKLARTEQGFEWCTRMKHGFVEGKSTSVMSSGRQVFGTNIHDGKYFLSVLEMNEYPVLQASCSITIWSGQTCSSRWVG